MQPEVACQPLCHYTDVIVPLVIKYPTALEFRKVRCYSTYFQPRYIRHTPKHEYQICLNVNGAVIFFDEESLGLSLSLSDDLRRLRMQGLGQKWQMRGLLQLVTANPIDGPQQPLGLYTYRDIFRWHDSSEHQRNATLNNSLRKTNEKNVRFATSKISYYCPLLYIKVRSLQESIFFTHSHIQLFHSY